MDVWLSGSGWSSRCISHAGIRWRSAKQSSSASGIYLDLCGEYLRWWVVEGRRFSAVAKLINGDLYPGTCCRLSWIGIPKEPGPPSAHGGEHWHGRCKRLPHSRLRVIEAWKAT